MSAHHHDHSHAPKNYNRAFIIGIILNGGFVAIEATYGIFANSLALLADAGHNLSDVLGLVLAWGASILSRRPLLQTTLTGCADLLFWRLYLMRSFSY